MLCMPVFVQSMARIIFARKLRDLLPESGKLEDLLSLHIVKGFFFYSIGVADGFIVS